MKFCIWKVEVSGPSINLNFKVFLFESSFFEFPPSISLFHSRRLSTHFAIEFEFRTLKDSDINKYLIKVIVKR